MTALEEYADRVRQVAAQFPDSQPLSVSLTYAAELVADEILPCRTLAGDEARTWVAEVCATEDIDAPTIQQRRPRSGVLGAACSSTHAVAFYSVTVTQITLLHEVAHLLAPQAGHGVEFRTCLVSLVRRHISVDHGSLLHTMYTVCDQTTRWQSTHR